MKENSTVAEKVRVGLQMPKETYEELEKMAEDSGISKGELFRLALRLFKEARQSVKRGHHVGVAKSADKLDLEFIGL